MRRQTSPRAGAGRADPVGLNRSRAGDATHRPCSSRRWSPMRASGPSGARGRALAGTGDVRERLAPEPDRGDFDRGPTARGAVATRELRLPAEAGSARSRTSASATRSSPRRDSRGLRTLGAPQSSDRSLCLPASRTPASRAYPSGPRRPRSWPRPYSRPATRRSAPGHRLRPVGGRCRDLRHRSRDGHGRSGAPIGHGRALGLRDAHEGKTAPVEGRSRRHRSSFTSDVRSAATVRCDDRASVKTLYRASRVHTLSYPQAGEWVLVDGRHVERVGSGPPGGRPRGRPARGPRSCRGSSIPTCT